MKFGRYINSHAIDEWRRAYINYRQLKKQIGRAEAELLELEEEEEDGMKEARPARRRSSAKPADSGRQEGGDEAPSSPRQSRLVSFEQRDLERGRLDQPGKEDDEGGAAKKDGRPPLPGSLSSHQPSSEAPPASRRLSRVSSASHDHSDGTGTSSRPLVRGGSQHSGHSLRLLRKPSDPKKDSARGPNRRWRDGLSPSMDLAEICERIPPQCRKFFTMLDKELERVSGFYSDREAEAVERYQQLSAQWKELADHKKEFQALREGELHAPAFVSSLLPKHAHIPSVPGSHLVRRTLAHRRPPPAQIDGRSPPTVSTRRFSLSSRETSNETRVGGREDAKKDSKAKKEVYLHGRPEEYMQARSKLKLATFEYYRYLGMLKSYRVLNRTGFAKALKKYEKATGIPCAAKYTQKVDAANFVSSTKLDDLIRETEDAFAEVFERGDRKKALERLRDFGQKKRHHFTSWRAGTMMGAGLVFMIEGLVLSFKAHTRRDIPYWAALLQLFGACFLPVFFSLAFFLDLAAWNYTRINYVLIFELDIRNRLDYHQFIELPALLYFILSLFWWLAWQNPWPDSISPSAYPLAWVIVMLVIMLNPLPVLYPSTRWWMLRSFCRMITSGLVAVEFRDFFLGDEMNSLYYSVYNLGFLYCTYSHGWPSNVFDVCSTNKTWTTMVLSALPAFWRLGQSIRRYLDSDGLVLHLLNAGKYSCSIAYFAAYYGWRIHEHNGAAETWRFALFIVFATINTCYTSTWDLAMDWSLFNRNVKDPKRRFLRNELGFFKDTPWMYWVAAVVNVLIRFSWVLYLTDKPVPILSYAVALAEAARRIMWNSFRVEAEHIGNRDGYRVTRDVALPYVTASSPEATGALVDDPDEDHTRRQRFFGSLHALHSAILKNFRPLTRVIGGTPWTSLGRRADPAEQERKEVEAQEREAAVDEEENEEARERKRRKDYELRRTRGRKRRGTMGAADDDSSSELEGSADEDDSASASPGSGRTSPAPLRPQEGAARRPSFGSAAPSASPSSSAPSSPGVDSPEQDAPSGQDEVVAAREAASSPQDDAHKMDREEGEEDQDEREDDQQLEDGMAEVEEMTKGLEDRKL
ncbi:hypothetical protein JCM10213_007531 [Rhodosporidiobolus nylandii]